MMGKDAIRVPLVQPGTRPELAEVEGRILFSLWPGTRGDQLWNRLGFAHQGLNDKFSRRIKYNLYEVFAPWWFVLGLLAILPLVKGKMLLRERRLRRWKEQGLCLVCGYDMRASPERCPECGTAVPSKQIDQHAY